MHTHIHVFGRHKLCMYFGLLLSELHCNMVTFMLIVMFQPLISDLCGQPIEETSTNWFKQHSP